MVLPCFSVLNHQVSEAVEVGQFCWDPLYRRSLLDINKYYFLAKNHKGQFISKCLFLCLQFLPKTNENTSHLVVKRNSFVCFFGIIHGLTICFRNYLTFRKNYHIHACTLYKQLMWPGLLSFHQKRMKFAKYSWKF